jgi:DNA-binding response OmpR family regulator
MRVLVVDDDLPMAAAIRRALRSVNVISEMFATNVAVGLRDARRLHPYDVIVLDAMLPDAGRFRNMSPAARSVATGPQSSMVTARAAVDDRIRGLDAGRRRLPDQAVFVR